MQVIDEVATVPRSMRRQVAMIQDQTQKVTMSTLKQVAMIQETQKDQKPEEVQISFKVYVDHAKDGQNDTMSCMKGAPHLVLTSKAGRTKPKCRKTRTSVHAMNSRERQPMKRCQKRWRHEREHQTCGPVDQCAHTSLSRGVPADHEAQPGSCKKRRVMPTPHSIGRRDLAEFTTVGTPTCRKETRVISTREGK